jgi:predicted DCC family thiol-disulfide oxidoreductase YuxK
MSDVRRHERDEPHGRATAMVLYDADCGFCRWSLRKLLAWDRRGRLRAVALQSPEADRLLAGVPAPLRMDSWHLVTPAGDVRSAGRAVAPLLELLPGGRPLAALASVSPPLTDAAYALVARNRSRLGRLVAGRRA